MTTASSFYKSPSRKKEEEIDESRTSDVFHEEDSALLDLRNDLDSARRLPIEHKDKLLEEIQLKLEELVESKQDYLIKIQEIVIENQKLKDTLFQAQQEAHDSDKENSRLVNSNLKVHEEMVHLKNLHKETKKQKRVTESELIRERAKAEQLSEVLKMLSAKADTSKLQQIQQQIEASNKTIDIID